MKIIKLIITITWIAILRILQVEEREVIGRVEILRVDLGKEVVIQEEIMSNMKVK